MDNPITPSLSELVRAFENADDKDWDHLFKMIPESGHGKFWRAVFTEARPMLSRLMAQGGLVEPLRPLGPEEGRYRKRPVVIEATQFTRAVAEAHILDDAPLPPGVRIVSWTSHPPSRKVHDYRAVIKTLEGPLKVSDGDWIITGIKGENYACKPDIFEATYELVLQGASAPAPTLLIKGESELESASNGMGLR